MIRFQTRQLEWAKVEDKRTLALAEDRGLDADGKMMSAFDSMSRGSPVTEATSGLDNTLP
jgi:hypothetical protein